MLRRISVLVLSIALAMALTVPCINAFAEDITLNGVFSKSMLRLGENAAFTLQTDPSVSSVSLYLKDNGKLKINRTGMKYDSTRGEYYLETELEDGQFSFSVTARYTGVAQITASDVVLHAASGDVLLDEAVFSLPIKPQAVEIATKEDLLKIHDNLAGNYVLTADITFNEADFAEDGDFYNDGYGWQPIGSSMFYAFTGTFEGNGHTISGLRINKADYNYIGFFGVNKGSVEALVLEDTVIDARMGVYVPKEESSSSGGTIDYEDKDVWTPSTSENDDSDLSGYDRTGESSAVAGGVCGYNIGEIINCYVDAKVSATTTAGGICAINTGAISGSYSSGTLSAQVAGGICANNVIVSKISDCMSQMEINAVKQAGGIAAVNNASEITNCLSLTKLTAENIGAVAVFYKDETVSDAYYLQTEGLSDAVAVGLSADELKELRFESELWSYTKAVPVLKQFADLITIGETPQDDSLYDIDGNGTVEIEDLAALKKVVAGLEEEAEYNNCDIDGDGKTTVVDLAILKKKIAGI